MTESPNDPIIPVGRGGPQRIPRPDHWRLGGPPPWAHLIDSSGAPLRGDALEIAHLVDLLHQRESRHIDHGWREAAGGHISAVLAAVFDGGHSGPTIIVTKRAPRMRSHRGELAFPGGRRDDEDVDLVATALREAQEEIALDPGAVRVIGQLDRFVTGGSNSLVHPVVATLEKPPEGLVANPDEVDEILLLPLRDLMHPEAWREELWTRAGRTVAVTFFELPNHTLWGATALMIRQLVTLWLEVPDRIT